jgi:hypothetical protein
MAGGLSLALRAAGARMRAPMAGSAKQSMARQAKMLKQKRKLDCFGAEFIIGPAIGRTRWRLAMTADKSSMQLETVRVESARATSETRGTQARLNAPRRPAFEPGGEIP